MPWPTPEQEDSIRLLDQIFKQEGVPRILETKYEAEKILNSYAHREESEDLFICFILPVEDADVEQADAIDCFTSVLSSLVSGFVAIGTAAISAFKMLADVTTPGIFLQMHQISLYRPIDSVGLTAARILQTLFAMNRSLRRKGFCIPPQIFQHAQKKTFNAYATKMKSCVELFDTLLHVKDVLQTNEPSTTKSLRFVSPLRMHLRSACSKVESDWTVALGALFCSLEEMDSTLESISNFWTAPDDGFHWFGAGQAHVLFVRPVEKVLFNESFQTSASSLCVLDEDFQNNYRIFPCTWEEMMPSTDKVSAHAFLIRLNGMCSEISDRGNISFPSTPPIVPQQQGPKLDTLGDLMAFSESPVSLKVFTELAQLVGGVETSITSCFTSLETAFFYQKEYKQEKKKRRIAEMMCVDMLRQYGSST